MEFEQFQSIPYSSTTSKTKTTTTVVQNSKAYRTSPTLKNKIHFITLEYQNMLIRVRTNVGIWKVDGLNADSSTVDDVIKGVKQTRPNVVFEKVGTKLCFSNQNLIF